MTRKPSKRDLELLERLELQLEEDRKGNNNIRVENTERRIDKLKYEVNIFNEEEKFKYIGELMENAFHAKSNIVQDRNVAENQYLTIIKMDKENPEAYYRHAFLQYKKMEWLKAINDFQHAREIHKRGESNFPLTEDQYIKAKLFIGYCAAQLARETIKEAAEFEPGVLNMEVEGISIEDLLDNLKDEINKTNIIVVTKDAQNGFSQEEYEEILDSLTENQLLLSFLADTPFIKKGNREQLELGGKLSNTLKRLLLNSIEDLPLTLHELNEYMEGEDGEGDINWVNYRKRARLLNEAFAKIGYDENLIYAIRGEERYKIKQIDFIIALGEEHHV